MKKIEKVSLSKYRDLTDFPAERQLQINNCGIKDYFQRDYTIFRPNGRKDYYLVYTALGWFEIEYKGEMVRVERGTCVIIMPEVPQLLSFTAEGAPTIFYVHFTGEAFAELMEFMTFNPTTFISIQDCIAFEIIFNRLVKNFLPLKAFNGRKPVYSPKVIGLLLELMDFLSPVRAQQANPEQDAITAVLLYINEHFREKVNLKKYAEIAHLSLSRFSHLFTEKVGVSPHKYVLSLRIEEAKELLMCSSMSVIEIAAHIGIDDPSYFSRIFRKHSGCSPVEYRKRNGLR
jgi:AraC family transcriptional regulator of arabinose operon